MDAQKLFSVQPSRNIGIKGKKIKLNRKGYFLRQLNLHRRKRALKRYISERHLNQHNETILDAWIECLKTLKQRNYKLSKLESKRVNWERVFDHVDSVLQNLENKMNVYISWKENEDISKRRSNG